MCFVSKQRNGEYNIMDYILMTFVFFLFVFFFSLQSANVSVSVKQWTEPIREETFYISQILPVLGTYYVDFW